MWKFTNKYAPNKHTEKSVHFLVTIWKFQIGHWFEMNFWPKNSHPFYRCLHSKVIPKGFRSNFHASSFSHSNQYRHHIQWAQNSFSRNIMRITIRAMYQKRNKLSEQILHCRSELSKICPAVLVQSIRAKIQDANSKLFKHLHQINAQKLDQLIGPQITSDSSPETSKL